MRSVPSIAVLCIAGFAGTPSALAQIAAPFDCVASTTTDAREDLWRGVASGVIPDLSQRTPPTIPYRLRPTLREVPTVTPADIVIFEDTNGVFLTEFTEAEIYEVMSDATNAILAEHGDVFDFVGFFLNFEPATQIGAAFHTNLNNDITGTGHPLEDIRGDLGIPSDKLLGWTMMWNLGFWSLPGWELTTQLVLGHETLHQWSCFLDPLPNGIYVQGNEPDSCFYIDYHYDLRVDAQGSCLFGHDWIGDSPATPDLSMCGGNACFNADIGGFYSWIDLYLMGLATPEEADATMDELRFLDEACSLDPYEGPVTPFSIADIADANGLRTPTPSDSQKDFKSAWVILHLPGDEPTAEQIDGVVAILNTFSQSFSDSTLGRASMDNTLGSIPGCLADLDGDGALGTADTQKFLELYAGGAGDPAPPPAGADFDESGALDYFDVAAFLQLFAAGCE